MPSEDKTQKEQKRGLRNALQIFRSPSRQKVPIARKERPIAVPCTVQQPRSIADTPHSRQSLNISSRLTDQSFDSVLQIDPSGDRKRTQRRYDDAVNQLNESLNLPRAKWESFELPTIETVLTGDSLSQLQGSIEKSLDEREAKSLTKNKNLLSKSKVIVEGAFSVISPFAKNALLIMKSGSAVHS